MISGKKWLREIRLLFNEADAVALAENDGNPWCV